MNGNITKGQRILIYLYKKLNPKEIDPTIDQIWAMQEFMLNYLAEMSDYELENVIADESNKETGDLVCTLCKNLGWHDFNKDPMSDEEIEEYICEGCRMATW